MQPIPRTKAELAKLIDHTNLAIGSTAEDVKRLCAEAKRYGFYSVCIPPVRVRQAAGLLKGSKVKIAACVGFPFGYSETRIKVAEAESALEAGADEIDMSTNIGEIVEGNYEYVRYETHRVADVAKKHHALLKVIIETTLLTDDQIKKVSKAVEAGGADFVKTCTTFGPRGVTIDDVKIIRGSVKKTTMIKAAGGIKTAEQAIMLIKAGADRLGSSRSVGIIESFGELQSITRWIKK